jgi:ribosome-associated translation inhibitor RaiA
MAELQHPPTVVVRGEVPDQSVRYAREKLERILATRPGRVLDARIRFDHHEDPARPRPVHVELVVDFDGRVVRARRSAPTVTEAVDLALDRLERGLDAVLERPRAKAMRHRDGLSWHHNDLPRTPLPYFPRPVEERTVVRRKTFAMDRTSIEEALFDLEALDHDFFLFVHDETGAEAVVYRRDGTYGISQRVPTPQAVAALEIPIEVAPGPPTLTEAEAIEALEVADAPFVFFTDADTGRGRVVYRRYDGHYGIVEPA